MLQQHKDENSTWCTKIQKHLESQSCKYVDKVIFFLYDHFLQITSFCFLYGLIQMLLQHLCMGYIKLQYWGGCT